MKPIVALLLLLLLPMSSGVRAQTTQDLWQHIALGDAAPDGALPVNDMVLDTSENTLWVGTREGLWRYDGRQAERWDSAGETDVRALWIDAQNRLWVGTTDGLLVLDTERRWDQRQEPLPDLDYPVWAISTSIDRNVWLATDRGILRLDDIGSIAASHPFTFVDNPLDTAVISIWQTGTDDVWLGTRDEGLFHFSQLTSGAPQRTEITPASHDLPALRINALWADEENGILWVGTEEGLCLLDLDDLTQPCQKPEQAELQDHAITTLIPDSDPSEAVWVATVANDTGRGTLWRYEVATQDLIPIHEDRDVRALAQNSQGQLWLGATDGLWQRRAASWRLLLGQQGGNDLDVQAITDDADGRLWVGSTMGLLRQDDGGDWHEVSTLAGQPVTCLWPDTLDGSMWACLAGQGTGVAHIASSGEVVPDEASSPLDDQRITDIWQDGEGRLWFATTNGIWQKNGSSWQAYPYSENSDSGPINPFVTGLTGDGAKGFWAGTLGGLSHFDGSDWQIDAPEQCATPSAVQALIWDADASRLWVGTRSGLVECDDQGQTIWTTEDNVIADDVRTLTLQTAMSPDATAGESDYLWIGTFDGLSRAYVGETSDSQLPVVSFNEESGLPNNRVQALHTTDAGTVLIGTPIGLWAYEPGQSAPQVRLCYPECAQASYDSLFQTNQQLALEYNEQGTLTAAGGDLQTPPNNLIYRFEITTNEGVTESWSSDGALPISTDGLPAGDEMRVRAWAYDRDFNPSTQPADLTVVRQSTPLWRRPLFWAGVLALALVAGAVTYRQTKRFRLHGYRDLAVAISPGPDDGSHLVQITAGRRVDLQEVHQLDWKLIEEPLSRIADDESSDELLRFVGRSLYDSLFSAEATSQLRDKLGLGSKGIRLRLRIEDLAQMETLPWEALHGDKNLQYLTTQANVALVRDFSTDRQLNPMERPLRLLLVCARPSNLGHISDEEITIELASIRDFAQEVTHDKIQEVKSDQPLYKLLDPPTFPAFMEELQNGYDFVHFIGHGGMKDDESVLYFEDDDGNRIPYTSSDLATAFNRPTTFTNRTPRLLFLNACRTGESDSRAGIKGLATHLVTEGRVPAVIGMGYPISSESAAAFCQFFYQTLIQFGQVDYAVAEGRKALYGLEGSDLRDWLTPRLYLSVENGIVYELA
jgi:ligand-binding sensor domain-containing protein